MSKFEAHITFDRSQAELVKSLVSDRWKFSQFDADPVMGDKPYCYLSAYGEDFMSLCGEMKTLVQEAKNLTVQALREKIEEIIYDTKTNYFKA